ncbi:MAG: hypothetical protein ABI165_03465 [Bryobacteraceae bacterium]
MTSLIKVRQLGGRNEPDSDAIQVVNPEWRNVDSHIRSLTGQRHRLSALFGALALTEGWAESEDDGFQQRNGHLREEAPERRMRGRSATIQALGGEGLSAAVAIGSASGGCASIMKRGTPGLRWGRNRRMREPPIN